MTKLSDRAANVPPLAGEGWSREILTVPDALVCPAERNAFRQPISVYDRRRKYVFHGATWRFEKRMTIPARPRPDLEQMIYGRWLWGGVIFEHFGHFLAETLSRLWALDHADRVDGVLFAPKNPRNKGMLLGWQRRLLDQFAPGLPVIVLTAPTGVEELVVPGQGGGIGEISAGTEEMRSYLRNRIPATETEGPKRIYVSRTGLSLLDSMIIGEAELEAHLVAEGFFVMRPETYDLAEQMAMYRQAEQIIIADGSSAHLFALCGHAGQQVAYLPRRSYWLSSVIRQLDSYLGAKVDRLAPPLREWRPNNDRKFRYVSLGELDLPLLGQQLAQAGYIDASASWPALPDDFAEQCFADAGVPGEFYIAEPVDEAAEETT